MTLGEKIKKLRGENKLTQADLAEKVHVTFQTVSKWEKDENEPDVSTIKELAKIFECSIDYLLSESEEKKENKEVEIVPVMVPTKCEAPKNEVVEKKLHKCEYCHKEIPEEELVWKEICTHHAHHHRGHTSGHNTYRNAYYHKECLEKKKQEDAKAEKLSKQKQAKSASAKVWGWSIPSGVVALLILLFSLLSVPDKISTGGAIGYSILGGVGIFTMIYCILSGSYIGDVFLWAAKLSVKFPGIIFSFDLGGFAFLIVMKLLFAILGFIIGVLAFIFAIVLSSALSIVSFPFILIHNIRTGYEDVLWLILRSN